jgi:hypothetical protein
VGALSPRLRSGQGLSLPLAKAKNKPLLGLRSRVPHAFAVFECVGKVKSNYRQIMDEMGPNEKPLPLNQKKVEWAT